MEQLKELKTKGERDKEALKKAIKAQKERAERSEEYAEQLNVQLAEKVTVALVAPPPPTHSSQCFFVCHRYGVIFPSFPFLFSFCV